MSQALARQTPHPAGLMERLRAATAAEHRAVERTLTLTRPNVTLDDYRRYLMRMWGVHAPFEARLDALPALAVIVPDVERRRRRPQLERDLRLVGLGDVELRQLPRAPLPAFETPAALLGALYVLEGSTLGGQLIRRHLEAVLGVRTAGAAGYLEAYDDVGAMWKRFRAALDQHALAHPEDDADIIAGALAMFRCIGSWLGAGPRA